MTRILILILTGATIVGAGVGYGCGSGSSGAVSDNIATLPLTVSAPSGAAMVLKARPPSGKWASHELSSACGSIESVVEASTRDTYCVALTKGNRRGQATVFTGDKPASDVTFVVPVPKDAQQVEYRGTNGARASGTIAVDGNSRLGVVSARRSELPGRVRIYGKGSTVLLISDEFADCFGGRGGYACTSTLGVRRP